MVYASIDALIGNTPLLRLFRLEGAYNLKAKLIGKLEFFNPAGSAKDRVALAMIEEAEKTGKINKDTVLIEPTSGNTGIGIASVAAARGMRAIIVMPETMSKERRLLMTAYGAELILTPGEKGMQGAIEKAEEIHKQIPNSMVMGQFDNPANAAAHYKTTGPEIYAGTEKQVDIFVAGVGTGGTITGVGKYLKEQNPKIQVIAVEPSDSPYLSEGRGGAHKLQGIGAGFIPKVLDTTIYDEVIQVSYPDALSVGRHIGKTEGFLVGISGGAAMHAAIEVAKRPENEGKTIVVLLPDTGERYLSTPLYDEDAQ